MKHLFAKWLSALLIAALLLTPVALMEETPDEPATAEAVVTEAAPAEEPVEEPDEEPDEEPVEETDEIIFEDVDVIVGEADAAELEAEEECFEETEAEFVSDEAAYALYGADANPEPQKDESGNILLNPANFTDENFRAYLKEKVDKNSDGALSANELNWYGGSLWDLPATITDLTGVKFLTYTTHLSCEKCNLTALDVSGMTSLTYLRCPKTLSDLKISGCSNLASLSCSGAKLSELDVSGCTALESLNCYDNKLSSLNVSGCSALKNLECGKNQLTALNVSGCTALETLYCYDNKLSSLDASNHDKLKILNASTNPMTALNVSGCSALESLSCGSTLLTTLNAGGCAALKSLSCSNLQLTDLNVRGCAALETLRCSGNKLTTLDISDCTEIAKNVTSANYKHSKYSNTVTYEQNLGYTTVTWLVCDCDVKIIGGNAVAPVARYVPESSSGSSSGSNGSSGSVTITIDDVVSSDAPQEPITISIAPTKVKAKAKKNKVTVTWKKLKKTKKNKAMYARIKGIEVQCSTDPNFEQSWYSTTVGKKKAKAAFKLARKTIYYVRVRYIDKTGGVSNWSAVKRVKTK